MKKRHEDPCARDGNYEDHAKQLNNRARKAHAEWWAGLSVEDKRKARDLHIDTAPDDNPEVGGHSPYSLSDIADTPLAKCDPNLDIDSPEDTLADAFGLTPKQATQIMRWHLAEVEIATRREKAKYLSIIVGGLLATKNPKLNAAGLAFAANLAALNGLPCQREYARQNHISASAISKVVTAWGRSLDLIPSVHQKSEKACKVYSQVGKTRHWRSRKIKASTATTLLQKIRQTNPANN